MTADPFDEHQRPWREYRATPWARLRYALVEQTLRNRLDGLGRLRVLDVGGGDAADSLPLAVAGHDVTVLDTSPAMLAAASADAAEAGVPLRVIQGSLAELQPTAAYDLVLCHFVVQYLDDTAADVARLAGAVRPGGMVSLIAPNPDGAVLAAMVRDGTQAALDRLDATSTCSRVFDAEVRTVDIGEAQAALLAAGCTPTALCGDRMMNELVADNEVKHDPAWFAELLRLELALHDREPFKPHRRLLAPARHPRLSPDPVASLPPRLLSARLRPPSLPPRSLGARIAASVRPSREPRRRRRGRTTAADRQQV